MKKRKLSEYSVIEKYFGALLAGGIIFRLIIQSNNISNTFNGTSLSIGGALFGLILAILATFVLKKLKPSIYDRIEDKMVIGIGLFIGLPLISLSMAFAINQSFANQVTTKCVKKAVLLKSKGGNKNRTSFIHVDIGQPKYRKIRIRRSIDRKIKKGQMVEICTQEGMFGYRFLTQITTEEENQRKHNLY